MTAAEWMVRRICRLLPPRLADWGEAMAQEAALIERPGAALIFAVGCVAWVIRQALWRALQSALTPKESPPGQPSRSRATALACAIAAAGLGLVYLTAAGAPMRHLTLNAAALIAGLIIVLPLRRHDPVAHPFIGAFSIALGLVLLLTAALGGEASGARRWMSLGDVVLQPSLIGLPFLLVGFARTRNILTATGVILAAAALACQPDAAMAGATVAALAAAALTKRDKISLAVLTAVSACFVVTLMRPSEAPAAQFVDGVFRTALSTGSLAGLAVWLGALLLLLPSLLGLARDREAVAAQAAFGATWLAIMAAAFAGNYPTPVVAYGGSAIVGYLLSTLALPRESRARPRVRRLKERPSKTEHRQDEEDHAIVIRPGHGRREGVDFQRQACLGRLQMTHQQRHVLAGTPRSQPR